MPTTEIVDAVHTDTDFEFAQFSIDRWMRRVPRGFNSCTSNTKKMVSSSLVFFIRSLGARTALSMQFAVAHASCG